MTVVQFRAMSLALFVALYFLEAGLVFMVAPWTRLWTLNPLLHRTLAVAAIADNPFVRGFVTGLGVVHLMIGVRDMVRLSRSGRAPHSD